MNMLHVILFLFIGGVGGFIGNKLRLPAGTLMGAMFAVGFSKYFGLLVLERSMLLTFIVQLLLGLSLGVSFSSLDKKQIKKLAKALVIVTAGVFVMTFGVGYILGFFTFLDLRTIFLSTVPGGLAEMSIIAKAIDLNSPVVAIFHIIRLMVVLCVFPIVLKYFYQKYNERTELQERENNRYEV